MNMLGKFFLPVSLIIFLLILFFAMITAPVPEIGEGSLERRLFPSVELPEMDCKYYERQFLHSWQIRIECTADEWGTFRAYSNILDFSTEMQYNDSLGLIFNVNPVEIIVSFTSDAGARIEETIAIKSNLINCSEAASCIRP